MGCASRPTRNFCKPVCTGYSGDKYRVAGEERGVLSHLWEVWVHQKVEKAAGKGSKGPEWPVQGGCGAGSVEMQTFLTNELRL